MTADDYRAAWALASRDDERERWRAMYDALIPVPAATGQQETSCSHLHGAFGPGCPWCTPRRSTR